MICGTQRTSFDTECRVVNRKLDGGCRVWQFNEPLALEVFKGVASGPAWSLEAATGNSEESSTERTYGISCARVTISVECESAVTRAGEGTIRVGARQITVI